MECIVVADTYSDYIDKSTNVLLETILSSDIDTYEKKVLISVLPTELLNHISNPESLQDWRFLLSKESVHYIDQRITFIFSNPQAEKNFDDLIYLIDRQIKYEQLFSENNWKWPVVINKNLNECIKKAKLLKEKQSLYAEIKNLDAAITSDTIAAEKSLSLDVCDNVIRNLSKLEIAVNTCKEKNIVIPAIHNKDIKRCTAKINSVRERAEKKVSHINYMYEIDSKILEIERKNNIALQDCQLIISLCAQQNKNLKKCEDNQWIYPELRYNKPSSLSRKYEFLFTMLDLDQEISQKAKTASDSKKQYTTFAELCKKQIYNIDKCQQNNWPVPELIYTDPLMLAENVRREYEKNERKISLKKKLREIVIVAVLLFAILIFIQIKYLENKIIMPYSPENVIGENYQTVLNKLSDNGFTNLITTSVNTGWENSDRIIEFTLNGKEEFRQGFHYDPQAKIEIVYSSSGRIDVTEILKDWGAQKSDDIEKKLMESGFSNIKKSETDTFDKKKENLVAGIKIYGNSYVEGECYLPKDGSIELFYYKYKIQIDENSDNFIGQDYMKIEKTLADKGFTNITTTEIETGYGKEKTVSSVTINGSDNFKKNDVFNPNDKIVINYYSGNRIDLTEILNDWQSSEYSTLVEKIENVGVTEIQISKVDTYEKENNLHISEIFVNNESFYSGICFIPQNANINLTYYEFKIPIKNNSQDFVGADFSDLTEQFADMGFTDITSDEITTGTGKGNSVIKVLINGRDDFTADEVFYPDDKILISFYSDDRVDVTQIFKDWEKQNYSDLKKNLTDLGFTKITYRSVSTHQKSQNQLVNKLEIEGTEYISGECYLRTSTKIIIYYYSLKIQIGKNASDFRKQEYKDVLNELEDLGFTNIHLQRSDDLFNGWVNWPGTVKSITIRDESNFKAENNYNYYDEITIVVNTFKGKDYEDITEVAK